MPTEKVLRSHLFSYLAVFSLTLQVSSAMAFSNLILNSPAILKPKFASCNTRASESCRIRRDSILTTVSAFHPSDVAENGFLLAQAVSSDPFKFFIAGGIAASFSHGITVPIDVVKTRLQTDDSLRSSGLIHATTTIIRNEGVSALSIGLGSTLIGYAIQVHRFIMLIFAAGPPASSNWN